MNGIFFNGKKVKDILVREDHEESESLASGWFETGLVDRVEVEVRDQTVSFGRYLEGELYSERFVHLSKMSSVKVLHFTKRTTMRKSPEMRYPKQTGNQVGSDRAFTRALSLLTFFRFLAIS